jgi:hypothetical protein
VLRGATDIDGRSVLATTRLRPDFPALREVRTDPVSFEGQTVVGVGVSERVGFRVFELAGPNRIVLDLAHPADDGSADGPKALTLTPDRGPVGTRVTVEGEDCAPGSARTLLVMQNGGTGTDGLANLGEFPNDRAASGPPSPFPTGSTSGRGLRAARPVPAPTPSAPCRRPAWPSSP